MRNLRLLPAALAVMVMMAGCSDDGTNNPSTSTLKGHFLGLGDLGPNAVYEGWLIVGGTPKSTGTFTADGSGAAFQKEFTVSSSDLSIATTFFVTVEAKDGNPAPSNAHLIAGGFLGSTAVLRMTHPEALGTNLAGAGGTYLLATPTDGTGTNEKSGIWFMTKDPQAIGLQLAQLPAGWGYEGWVVINGTPVSMGKFTDVNTADMSRQFSGTQAGWLYPGEDFLQNAPNGLTFPTDLSGSKVMITIEPDPDYSVAPFFYEILNETIPATVVAERNYSLSYDPPFTPTGEVTR